MARIYETLSGHRIEYPEPDPKVEKFIKRAAAMIEDRKVLADDLVALVYGSENPILEAGPVPGAGLVTKDVLDNPVYHVLADIIFRKQVAQSRSDVERITARYTLTAAEAAERKGVSVDAIRAAARERRLPSWVKDGAYFFEPKALDAVQLGKRGPVPKNVEPLALRLGYDADARAGLKVKALTLMEHESAPPQSAAWDNVLKLERWRRVGVLTSGHGKLRFFELEPSDEERELEFHGFFVRGKFAFVRKVNNPKEAKGAWEAFVAS
jgi:hypothetical protein